jgi:thiamine biosynthesis lipoprotein
MGRRRFLALSASAMACAGAASASALAQDFVWQGRGLGAELSVRLSGADPGAARRAARAIENALRQIEEAFSLHRDSALTRLNRDGWLPHPGADWQAVAGIVTRVHAATGGVFDPSIQPLFLAIAQGGDVAAARALVDWRRVRVSRDEVRMPPRMALSFNGIAQGHAADRIAAILTDLGFTDVLIDMGEVLGLGQRPDGTPWRAAVVTPEGAEVARLDLRGRALATSAPLGTRIGPDGAPHILHPAGGAARWSLAAVSGPQAAVCDALSTAFCLMEPEAIMAALAHFPGTRIERLVHGNSQTRD